MRDVVALVFNYSLNGYLADEGTDFYRFCFELLDAHGGADHDDETIDFLRGASAHVMGRDTYEGFAAHMPDSTELWPRILNEGRKVVFSRTLTTAAWAGTTIASGDTAEEVDALRRGGDGHVLVWGGVRLWRSLMRLDLIDEFRLSVYPWIADGGTRMFDDVPPSYRLDLVSSAADEGGVLELRYRRHR